MKVNEGGSKRGREGLREGEGATEKEREEDLLLSVEGRG